MKWRLEKIETKEYEFEGKGERKDKNRKRKRKERHDLFVPKNETFFFFWRKWRRFKFRTFSFHFPGSSVSHSITLTAIFISAFRTFLFFFFFWSISGFIESLKVYDGFLVNITTSVFSVLTVFSFNYLFFPPPLNFYSFSLMFTIKQKCL